MQEQRCPECLFEGRQGPESLNTPWSQKVTGMTVPMLQWPFFQRE